jgi:hypothetical protein
MRDPIIDALVEEKEKFAREALLRVGEGDPAYEYGYRLGMYAGLERAIARILALYRDDRGDNFE